MNRHRTTASSRRTREVLIRSMLLVAFITASGPMIANAGAGVTKTRFDLDRSRVFTRFERTEQPQAVASMTERWMHVIPPWHTEVLAVALPLAREADPPDRTDPVPGVATHVLVPPGGFVPSPQPPRERSHDGAEEEVGLSDHGGWEEVVIPPFQNESGPE